MKRGLVTLEQSGRATEKGYSLIELMIALLIISISVLALYQMLISGRTMIMEENHRRLGLEKVQYYFEKCKFAAVDSGYVPRRYAGTFNDELVPPSQGQENGIECEVTVRIDYSSQRDENNIPAYSHVTVGITWTEGSGRDQEIPTMETYIRP